MVTAVQGVAAEQQVPLHAVVVSVNGEAVAGLHSNADALLSKILAASRPVTLVFERPEHEERLVPTNTAANGGKHAEAEESARRRSKLKHLGATGKRDSPRESPRAASGCRPTGTGEEPSHAAAPTAALDASQQQAVVALQAAQRGRLARKVASEVASAQEHPAAPPAADERTWWDQVQGAWGSWWAEQEAVEVAASASALAQAASFSRARLEQQALDDARLIEEQKMISQLRL